MASLDGYAQRDVRERTFFTPTLFNYEAPNLKVWSPSGGQPPHDEHVQQSPKHNTEPKKQNCEIMQIIWPRLGFYPPIYPDIKTLPPELYLHG